MTRDRAKASVMFGLARTISPEQAVAWHDYLLSLWRAQIGDGAADPPGSGQSDCDDLQSRLVGLKRWFDPVASSRRLRELIEQAPEAGDPPFGIDPPVTLTVGPGRRLITPEGVAVLWLLERAALDFESSGGARATVVPMSDIAEAMEAVNSTYRGWVQQKIRGAAALLVSETSTLRPTAAGLLFFMLLNRHTAASRVLLRPRDPDVARAVNEAIGPTILAFARAFGGSARASSSGFDVYRGWAYGEIARRLGQDWCESPRGVWIEQAAAARAIQRLGAFVSLAYQKNAIADTALRVAVSAYDESRPALVSLGMAFERPASTAALLDAIAPGSLPGTVG